MTTIASDLLSANILYVEDDAEYVTLVKNVIGEDRPRMKWAKDLAAARAMLGAEKFDLVLLDYVLPDGNGLSFLEEIKVRHPDLPVLILSGRKDESMALSSVKKGAVDFILKEELWRDLMPAMESILRRRWLASPDHVITDRLTPWMEPFPDAFRNKFKGRFLDNSAEFYQTVLQTMNEGCLVLDQDGVITYVNPALEKMTGEEEAHLLGGDLWEIFDDETNQRVQAFIRAIKQSGQADSFGLEGRLAGPPGPVAARADITLSGHSIHDRGGHYKSCVIIVTPGVKSGAKHPSDLDDEVAQADEERR